jgi:hypothetical protein
MAKFKISDLDLIFISYDEPKAEEFWANLKAKAPWAKRSHGVEGSDACHKAAANLSDTPFWAQVDGDTIIDPEWLNLEVEYDDARDILGWCWKSYNQINGSTYGNGGVKVWSKQGVLDMKTHENTTETDNPAAQIEFCWEGDYFPMHNIYGTTFPNGSPFQAWRAGFREGVKLSLNQGHKVKDFKRELWQGNLKHIEIWQSVGRDVENGLWAIFGARMGTYLTYMTDWDYVNVRHFPYLKEYWEAEILPKYFKDGVANMQAVDQETRQMAMRLRSLGLEIAELDASNSKFFKKHQYMPSKLEANTLEKQSLLRFK